MIQTSGKIDSALFLATRTGAWVATGCVVGVALLGLYASRAWPIYHDAPLMFFVAQRILEGAAPYRDVIDMNMPGAYLVSMAVLHFFGMNDFAWRLVDIGVLLAMACCVYALLRPAGWIVAATACAAVVLYHLKSGSMGAGQRDFLMILPVLCSAVLFLNLPPGRPRAHALGLMTIGALIAVAASLKPTAIALLPMFAGLMALVSRSVRLGLVGIGYMGCGFVAVAALLVTWLFGLGALGNFIHLQSEFVLSSYAQIRVGRSSFVGSTFVFAGLAGTLVAARSKFRERYLLLLLLMAFGALHFFGQGKGWPYHSDPLAVVSIVAAFLSLAMIIDALRSVMEPSSVMPHFAVLLAQGATLGLVLDTMSIRPWFEGRFSNSPPDPFIEVLRDDIRLLGDAGTTVQPLDTTFGVLNAMLRAKVTAPTRQMYSFPLLMEPRTAYLDGLRSELLTQLRDSKYPPIVRSNQQWPYENGYDRLEAWHEFRTMIESKYEVAIDRTFPNKKGYRIYVARRS